MPVMNRNSREPPPAIMKRIVRKVEYDYIFLETVHSLEELDAFRLQHFCTFGNAKRNDGNFTKATLNCIRRSKAGGMCPFSLMAQRPFPKSSDIDIYKLANSEHNHTLKPAVERVAYRVPYEELVPDADPSANFTTPETHEAEEQMDEDFVEAKEWPIEEIKCRLCEALREGNAGQVDKWMAKTGQRRIGTLLQALDGLDMIKLLQMAERKAREGRGKKNIYSADWLVWLRETLREVLLLLSLTQHSELNQLLSHHRALPLCTLLTFPDRLDVK